MEKKEFTVKFWGVRGSRPVPGPDTLIYGGNTSCVQVQIGERLIILDGGTGICNLGKELMKNGGRITGDILFTHVHWDHIQGFPFFTPAFVKGNFFNLYGEEKQKLSFEKQMSGLMSDPHFPVKIDILHDQIKIFDVKEGQTIDIGSGINIRTARNNHPNGSISYRVEHGGRSVCYVTDTEHYEGRIDPILREFIKNADVVIYDANYTDEEYYGLNGMPSRRGWGHSTWQEGIKLVKAAGAKKLILFHHNSDRTDGEQKEIDTAAQRVYAHCESAKEGMEIIL